MLQAKLDKWWDYPAGSNLWWLWQTDWGRCCVFFLSLPPRALPNVPTFDLSVYGSHMEAREVGKVSLNACLIPQCFTNTMEKCHWAPLEMLTLLHIPELNLQRIFKNPLKETVALRYFLGVEKEFSPLSSCHGEAIIDAVGKLLLGIWMNTQDFLPCNTSCSFSLA